MSTNESDTFAQYVTDNYEALRRYAKSRLHGLESVYQPTAVLHEAYLKIVISCQNNEGSAPSAALLHIAMERMVIDLARKKKQRRGAEDKVRDHAADVARATEQRSANVRYDDIERREAANECFSTLQANNALAAEVFVYRKFYDITIEKTAVALQISEANVSRKLALASALLTACLNRKYPPGSQS